MGIMVLFLIHLIWGSFILIGFAPGGNQIFRIFAYLLMILVVIHTIIGVILTIKTVLITRRAGVSYKGENRLFYIRRISGFALLIFIGIHVWLLTGITTDTGFRMRLFDMAGLITQLLMVLSLGVHLLCNITPLRIALGIEDKRSFRTDILLVLAVLLFLAGIAFVVYLIRWMSV